MAAEGIFPKTNGDVVYASEVNTFIPKFIGQIDQDTLVNTSGTSAYFQMGNAITYPGAGSLQCNYMIVGQASVGKQMTGTVSHTFRMRISGVGLNIATTPKSDTITIYPTLMHVWTSGAITASGGNIGSQYSITVEGNSAQNSATSRVSDFIVYGW